MKTKSKNSFVDDVITLSFVPILTQFIGLFLLPIITRLYDPYEFGLFNTFSSITAFLGVFSTLAYHSSILLPKNKKDAIYLLASCLIFNIIFTILVLLAFVIFKDFLLEIDDIRNLKNYLLLIPLFVFFHGLFQTLRYWNTRLKKFKIIALSKITEGLLSKTLNIGYGFYISNKVAGLIYGILFASFFKNLILFFSIKNHLKEFFNLSIKKFFKILKRYKKFPIFALPSELLSRLPAIIIVVFMLRYFDASILGNYSLAITILAVPTVFFTNSIIEAFSPRVADAVHENNHKKIILDVYQRIFSLTFYVFIIIIFFGDHLFSFLFGEEWIIAGIIAQILAFRSLFEVITIPIISLTSIVEKQELGLFRRLSEIIVTVLAFVIGAYFDSYIYTFIMYSIFNSIVICMISYKLINHVDIKLISFYKKIKFYLMILSIIICLCFLYKLFASNSIILFFMFLAVLTFFYYGMVLVHDNEIRNQLLKYIYNGKK